MSNTEAVKTKVARYLTDLFGPVELYRDDSYTLRYQSARIFVKVVSTGENELDPTLVKLELLVLTGVRLTPELETWVAFHTDDFLLGHFSLFEQENGQVDLFLSHRLVGDYLDPMELELAVAWMLRAANDLDETLQAQFGGSRFHED